MNAQPPRKSEADTSNLNGDLSQRVLIDTRAMAWSPSPSATVWRKRLHRVGPAEAGQVTSVVRYAPDSAFPVHDHPDGEEILVLDGVFSDEAGDWPAGTYLLNPEGFRHAPHSAPGCTLFVKLRQYPGRERAHVAVSTDDLDWQPGPAPGVEIKPLYRQPGFADSTRLERWLPGTTRPPLNPPDGAEIFVLDGECEDGPDRLQTHCWLRLPAGTAFAPATKAGCTVYIKESGFRYLTSSR